VPFLGSSGGTKNSISICSNSRTRKRKFPGVISLRNDLLICAIPKGGLRRAIWSTFLKLMKMPCASPDAGSKRALAFERADVGLKHEVELPRLGQIALREFARMLARLAAALRLVQLILAKAERTYGSRSAGR
jgi:hypothetical protein